MRLKLPAWAIVVVLCLQLPNVTRADEPAATKVYGELRTPADLEAFLRAFPKGGDLHSHLGGAIPPEKFIEIAVQHGFCLDERLLLLVQNLSSACPAGMAPAATLQPDSDLYRRLVEAMSMRGYRGDPEKAHDHFFRAFRVRIPLPGPVFGDELEDVVRRAAAQNMTYLELMIYPFSIFDADKLTALLKPGASMTEWLETLEASQIFRDFVADGKKTVERGEAELQERLPAEAAVIERRYLVNIGRTRTPENVFAQIAAVAALARLEPRVVGINLVGAEDNAVALRDFRLHMRMLAFVLAQRPYFRVTLHAGELTPAILRAAAGDPPEALTFHIAESIRDGHAERVGHGSDLRYEKNRDELLRTMRERGILAEICLTSESVILGLPPAGNPFPDYRKAGVPVSLNTDDEGVLDTDLTREFLRAARDYRLSYTDLKQLARNSIEYSFLPGKSLFRSREYKARVPACPARRDGSRLSWAAYRNQLPAACRAYLDQQPKANTEARLEHQFQQFESSASLARFHPRDRGDR